MVALRELGQMAKFAISMAKSAISMAKSAISMASLPSSLHEIHQTSSRCHLTPIKSLGVGVYFNRNEWQDGMDSVSGDVE
jgi:hypothetical protein